MSCLSALSSGFWVFRSTGFILLRTSQGAPHLESRATSLSELYDVVTAKRFATQRFAFSPRTVLTVQLPVVLSVVARDLGTFGVLFLAGGLLVIASRPDGAGILVAGAALGSLAMVVNLSGDLKGFINPIVVLLWPLVALGADAASRVVDSPRAIRAGVTAIATIAMSAIPVLNVHANYAELDRSSQVEEGRFFRSLFAQLPDRSAIVAEDYFFDMALLYLRGHGGRWSRPWDRAHSIRPPRRARGVSGRPSSLRVRPRGHVFRCPGLVVRAHGCCGTVTRPMAAIVAARHRDRRSGRVQRAAVRILCRRSTSDRRHHAAEPSVCRLRAGRAWFGACRARVG